MLPQIKKILFTSDLTATSKHAFAYAVSLAGRYCAEMVFLYVMEDVPQSAKGFLDQEIMDKIRRQAADDARGTLLGKRQDMHMVQSELQRFCTLALAETEDASQGPGASEVVVAEGNVVDTIIATANDYHCDAIVMGTARPAALGEARIGSVIKGVLRRSNRMVVIAPPPPKKMG